MLIFAIFMVVYGYKLCVATWNNTIAEFPALRVGIVYSPIPCGGVFTLLFIIEHLTIGRPAREADPHHRAGCPFDAARGADPWTFSFFLGRCSCASASACRSPMRSASARWSALCGSIFRRKR